MFRYLKSKIRKDEVRGFTLIELVVSISIIVTLTSMVLPAVNNVRKQARNTARAQTLRELQSSIDDYFDENGSYPVSLGGWLSSENDTANGLSGGNGGNWIPGLAPKYIKALPVDPLGKPSAAIQAGCSTYKGGYLYYSPGDFYVLLAHCAVEGTSSFSITNPFYDPVRPNWSWKICGGRTSAQCDAL